MIPTLQRFLFALAAGLVLVDLAWGAGAHFRVDATAYGRIALLAASLTGAGLFYQKYRGEPAIAAMLLGASFLCAFSAAASLLNYFLLTAHGPRIDAALAATDRALGFNWLAAMTAMAGHPWLNRLFFVDYNIMLPEIALMVVALGWTGNADKIYRFCIAIAVSALICILVWALAPSFGAMSVYRLPHAVAQAQLVSVDGAYGEALVAMLRNGPGFISPADVRGLIGFPSYHGVLALIVAWYARGLPRLFWPVLMANMLVLVATPLQGGHHLVDVLAAFPVAALAIILSSLRQSAESSAKLRRVVNKVRKNPIRPVPQGHFRVMPEQLREIAPPAIKAKLSGADLV
jgi:hypothetical protein